MKTGPIVPHWKDELTDEEIEQEKNEASDYFHRQHLLVSLGLIEWLPHLMESSDEEAEIIHPYGTGGSDVLEDRLGEMAHEAAWALMTDRQRDWTENEGYNMLVPVPSHVQNVQMIGIARLRYRPHTKLTGAWRAELDDKGNRYISRYEQIAEKALNPREKAFATG